MMVSCVKYLAVLCYGYVYRYVLKICTITVVVCITMVLLCMQLNICAARLEIHNNKIVMMMIIIALMVCKILYNVIFLSHETFVSWTWNPLLFEKYTKSKILYIFGTNPLNYRVDLNWKIVERLKHTYVYNTLLFMTKVWMDWDKVMFLQNWMAVMGILTIWLHPLILLCILDDYFYQPTYTKILYKSTVDKWKKTQNIKNKCVH